MLNTVNDVVHRLGERDDFAGTVDRITSEKMDVIREIAERFRNDHGMGSNYWYEMDDYIDERKNELVPSADNAADVSQSNPKEGLDETEDEDEACSME